MCLGRELDALRESADVRYIFKRGRLAGVLLDADRFADLLERLEYLEATHALWRFVEPAEIMRA